MIARSRLVGNFLCQSRVQCQLTKVVGLCQSVPLQSTNDNSEKNITLKLPPNATGVSVEHSNETSSDGTNLCAILNISVLQSNKSAPESEQSRQQFKTVETKYQSYRELKVIVKQQNEILINDLSKKVSEDDLRAYFFQFEKKSVLVGGRSLGPPMEQAANGTQRVEHVLNFAPHYLIADKITNESEELFAEMKKFMRTKCQRHQEINVNSVLEKVIWIDGLAKEISLDEIRTYFSQFGQVVSCGNKKEWSNGSVKFKSPYVKFKSQNAVNEVLNSGPYYLIGDKITNETQQLFSLMKKAMHIKEQSPLKLKMTVPRRVKEWFSKMYSGDNLIFIQVLAIYVFVLMLIVVFDLIC